jgi:hypothetical protein
MPRDEQLRRANQDAYMCTRCQFGQIAHPKCSDVSWKGNKCRTSQASFEWQCDREQAASELVWLG